jgi:hypothetical protein
VDASASTSTCVVTRTTFADQISGVCDQPQWGTHIDEQPDKH